MRVTNVRAAALSRTARKFIGKSPQGGYVLVLKAFREGNAFTVEVGKSRSTTSITIDGITFPLVPPCTLDEVRESLQG